MEREKGSRGGQARGVEGEWREDRGQVHCPMCTKCSWALGGKRGAQEVVMR